MKGVIIEIKLGKGYGFLRGLHDAQNRFFHARAVLPGPYAFNVLHEGQAVEFEEGEDRGKGPCAEKVRGIQ